MQGRTDPSNTPDDIRERPVLPDDYEAPIDREGMVAWEWVVEQLEKARNYWVCTVRPDNRPHAVPVWAAWIEGTLYFDGHPQTRWARNLANNPALTVHLENGNQVVILEGTMQALPSLDRELAETVVAAFAAKYDYPPEVDELVRRGMFALRPDVVFAWTSFPRTVTRWRFA
ncbi:MAG TPA: pyridoxamine 5'-phosphate oxidase family protein [Chloroflexia bacterium]|jgi:nitroimidazol reductase NimA-like FMN-containing flavoprotein (pyridoxamine 5'-phosphate oxidase superfamily)